MKKFVIYTRVSTAEQGKSGLGLAAQLRDIEIYLTSYAEIPYEIAGSFAEVESGGNSARPELLKAIALAKQTGAELLVAKLDRLSRKVAYLAQLMDDKKLQIRVASMPNADKFQLHIYAALAEQERDFISSRTKAALAAAKARGVKLGGDRAGALAKANKVRGAAADAEAFKVMGVVGPMRAGGQTLQEIADELSRITGGNWSPMKVSRAIGRDVLKVTIRGQA
jgi:DNA invertase Pin-like site-specific DNA recombinase